jgi:hypothetical protein
MRLNRTHSQPPITMLSTRGPQSYAKDPFESVNQTFLEFGESMKLAKYLVGASAMVVLAFTATADHASNPYEIARQAGYVKSDAENLLIGLARGRAPQSFELINLTGMVAKEAQDLERTAENRGGRLQEGNIQKEARDVFVAFRALAREFRADRSTQNHRAAFQRLRQSIQDLGRYVGSQNGGYDGHDDGYDGHDGQDGGHDGHDGGHDGQDGGYEGGIVDGYDGSRN